MAVGAVIVCFVCLPWVSSPNDPCFVFCLHCSYVVKKMEFNPFWRRRNDLANRGQAKRQRDDTDTGPKTRCLGG